MFALGPFWHQLVHLHCVFADLGAGLGSFWPILGPSWGQLGLSHEPQTLYKLSTDLGHGLGPSWPTLGPSWHLLALSWASLGPLLGLSWPIFGLSWASLGPSWAVLGSSSDQVGPTSPHLARILAQFGASPGHVPLPWAVLAAFGAFLAPFGGPFWTSSGRIWLTSYLIFLHLETYVAPSSFIFPVPHRKT